MAPALTRVDQVLRATARAEGGRAAFVDPDGTVLTYAEWDARADAAAAWLQAHGVRARDVVALMLGPSSAYPVWYMGTVRAGATASGINQRLGPAEIDSIMRRCPPAVTIRDGDVPGTPPRPASFDRLPDVPVAVVWTSGTTGEPKGAVFGHNQLAAVAAAQGPLTSRHDVYLAAVPFAHVGFMTKVWANLACATTQVIVPAPWRAATALELIERHGVTVAGGVPAQWRLMLDHPDFGRRDLSSVRQVALGGASIDPALVGEIRERLRVPVVNRYTCTEAAVTTGTTPGDPDEVVAHTVGRPVHGVQVRLAGAGMYADGVGEIQCRSAAVMSGYWRDPARTAEVLSPDGWLSTGDLGRWRDDGNLVVVGRSREMYVRGGYNVYPAEVEARLSAHPSVGSVAVVGVPDRVLGETGVAFVVPAGAAPDLQSLRTWCAQALADYKSPDRLEVVEALPLTAMHKIDKAVLRAAALGQAASVR